MSKGRKRKPFTKLLRNVQNSGSRARAMTKKRLGKFIEVKINENDLQELWNKQNGKCHWLSISLELDWLYQKWHPFAPSVDRISEGLGYVKENIVICSRITNLGRQKCEPEKFRTHINFLKEQIFKQKNEQ